MMFGFISVYWGLLWIIMRQEHIFSSIANVPRLCGFGNPNSSGSTSWVTSQASFPRRTELQSVFCCKDCYLFDTIFLAFIWISFRVNFIHPITIIHQLLTAFISNYKRTNGVKFGTIQIMSNWTVALAFVELLKQNSLLVSLGPRKDYL